MAGEPLTERIEAFLDAHHVVTLATVGDAGAHAASLMYARNGFTLYWKSDPQRRHSQHLGREARFTATVAPDYTDFRVIRGLQIAGRARRLDGREADEARGAPVARYAFLAELASGPPKLRAAFAQAAFYALVPERITLIDNSRGFRIQTYSPAKETTLSIPSFYGPILSYKVYIFDSSDDGLMNYDRVLVSPTKEGDDMVATMGAQDWSATVDISVVGIHGGFYMKVIDLAPDLSQFRLYFTPATRLRA